MYIHSVVTRVASQPWSISLLHYSYVTGSGRCRHLPYIYTYICPRPPVPADRALTNKKALHQPTPVSLQVALHVARATPTDAEATAADNTGRTCCCRPSVWPRRASSAARAHSHCTRLLFPWIYSISNNKHTGVGAGGPHTTRLTWGKWQFKSDAHFLQEWP